MCGVAAHFPPYKTQILGKRTTKDRFMLFLIIILALIYAFLNGYRDSSSILAGVIASRAMHPRLALYLSAVAEFIAPFIFGAAVARTIATGLVKPADMTLETLAIAMISAIAWTFLAWRLGIPSSSSHALIGGLLGVTLIANGTQAIQPGGLVRVVLPLLIAPPLGLLFGFLTMHLLLYIFRNATPSINTLFRRLQILTMLGLATAFSANDAQKSIGIITLGLVLAGRLSSFHAPVGVVFACAAALALGASRGDWRLIRTLGGKIYRIRPLNALASQTASAGVVMGAALGGAPVSTSQVISMALLGAGAAERVNKVRWHVGTEMLVTWGLTIPVTMAISCAIYLATTEIYRIQWIATLIVSWLTSG
jgi:inorganic phosphate transporter, PiT family